MAKIDLERIKSSFHELAVKLAHRAYWRAEENGDWSHYIDEDMDLEDLFSDYWSHSSRYMFLSAFYDLAPVRRAGSVAAALALRS